jgi:hypothetical protein
MYLIENLIRENHLEKVLASNLPQEIKQDWQEFFEEYEQKKYTSYIDKIDKLLALSKEEVEEILYITIQEFHQDIIDILYTCKNVKVIALAGNYNSITFNLSKLVALRFVTLRWFGEIIIEDTSELCKNIYYLDISHNSFQELPDWFGNQKKLQVLNCAYNQLKILPESIGNLSNLQQLDCSDNILLNLPENFGNLDNLQQLNCSSNQLQNFPKSIGNLKNLQQLICLNNKIESFPESFGKLISLQYFEFTYNKVQNLPKSFGNLGKLQQLYCSRNQLQKLPLSFSDLRNNLQTLNYSENPFTEMPEIKEMGLGRLMDYLDEKRGRKPHKIVWKMSKELHKTLQKYLVGFQDFVFTLSGKEIKLEVHRQDEGLELVIEPRELSMAEIDDYLALYVGDKLEIDFEALKSKFSLTELFEAKRFLEEHKREKENLLYELRYLKDKCELIEGRNKELWITITFFQNQSEQHLEIILNQQKQLEIKQTTVNANPNLGLMLPAGFQQNGLRKIKIFLASSAELKDVRMALRDFLSTENDKYTEYGIYFEIVQWEFAGESISAVSKQGDYNEKLKGCEVFLGLFWTKVGKYTEEEFNVAYAQFKAGEQPSVLYTYFKELLPEKKAMLSDADLLSLLSFKSKLHNEIKHFQSNFTEINDLKVQLKHQIEIEILPKLLNQKV